MELQPADLQQLVCTRRIILLLMFCLFLNKVELAPISHEEAEALLQFKAHLSIPSQALLTGWHASNTGSLCNTSASSSSWVGVTCSSLDHLDRIQLAINLTGLGLAGSLAPHVGNLTALTSLDLSYNSLSGPIPPQLSGCSSLRLLILTMNNFSGTVPSSLASLSALQTLGLCLNCLSGRMPQALLTNLTNLRALGLCANSLTGSLPTDIASPRLRILRLWQNYLRGHIPPSLLNCTQLTALDLVGNAFTGPIPSQLGLLSLLTDLKLGRIITNVSYTDESAKLAESAEYGHNWTFTAGPIPQSLGNCTQLIELVIVWSALTGSIPTELTKLPRLRIMSLDGNHLSGPLKLTNVSTSLYALTVQSNHLTGSIPPQLGHLQGLQALGLTDNSFSGTIPWMSLSNCSSLYELSFAQNHLHGTIPNIFGSFQNLQILYLDSNLLQGGIPNFEGPSLLELDLSFNQLNGSLPSLGLQVSTVSSLNLSHIQLSGTLPSWLGELAMVQYLDLSNNHFEGSIPPPLGDCVALIGLDLSHNHLSAGLPMQLRNLSYLEALDLSSNKLSGVLPSFLGSMRRLQFLDVSFNNFTGAIPPLGIFKHLNSSFLQGNLGLCGPIINKTCPSHHQHLISHNQHLISRKAALLAIALPLLLVVAVVCMVWIIMHYRAVKLAPRSTTICLVEVGTEARKYTADELTRATRGYSEESVLGQGGFAVVYKAVLADGMVVAVKKFKDVSFRKELLREVEIVSKLRHRNLVRVLGCVLNLEVNALVLQYMPNGSLLQYLDHHQAGGTLRWRMLTNVVRGVADALTYLHHEYGIPIIHGDVKPNNILLDSDFEPHLADFGLAKLVSDGAISMSSNLMGSIGYMAPEYTYSARVTTKVDVYSFGVVVLQLLTGRKPTELPGLVSFHEWLKTKVLDDVGLQEVLHESLSNDTNDRIAARRLIRIGIACTRDHPTDRPSMQEISALLPCIKVE